ncbi:unnamed protein product [Linum trigynum]|uniref:Uncharacterized protein n=1 Tax=Linum trigynum TaxID=586398 RepID=A0AAV2GIH2_9ROSI
MLITQKEGGCSSLFAQVVTIEQTKCGTPSPLLESIAYKRKKVKKWQVKNTTDAASKRINLHSPGLHLMIAKGHRGQQLVVNA